MRISIEQFVLEAGLERGTVERWVARGWLLIDDDALSDIDAARARFIGDLLGDLGVNEEGVDLILHLTDQVHGLRAALTAARARGREG
jgi:chaperone modulatory protein CbpM